MADTYDLLTLPEAYAAINDPSSASSGSGSNDARLAQMVTAISRRIDDRCGPVVQRTVSNEEQPGHRHRIALRYRPVSSITTITEYSGTTGQVLAAENFPDGVTANDYKLIDDGVNGIVERRQNGEVRSFAWGRVIVTYVAGRAATTAAVDPKFKNAAAAILRRLWEREAGRWAAGGDPFNGDVATTSIGFFKAVDPMITEFLGADVLSQGIA